MKRYEKLIYHKNIIPSRLAMLFLIFNTWQTILTLNAVDVPAAGIRIMEIILLNVLLSFLVFITASEIKRYNIFWSRAGTGIGIFQCFRTLFILSTIPENTKAVIAITLLISGFLLIFSSGLSIVNCRKYTIALKE
jgi:hypothetical protein